MFHGPGKRVGPVGGPITVWCLGDSITRERALVGASYIGSYRCYLFQALTALGVSPNFIGTILNSIDEVSCAGTAHTGLNGASPANWNAEYFATYAPAIGGTPDAVIVLLGANGANNDATAGEIWGVVQQALAMWPNVTVFLMTMYAIEVTDFAIMNAGLRSRAANEPKVVLVDQAGAITPADWSDGLHLNAQGLKKLSDAIIDAFVQRVVP